jgi:hypothetical protein
MKRKIKYSILFIFITNACISQSYIKFWHEGKLTENDFIGKVLVNKSSIVRAQINAGVMIQKDSISKKEFFVAYTNRANSFIKGTLYQKKFYPYRDTLTINELNEKTLKHEQMHFDIAEIFSRKANQMLLEKNTNPQKILNKIIVKLNKFQIKFDDDTMHGNIEYKTDYYKFYIEEELEKLDEFKYKERKQ